MYVMILRPSDGLKPEVSIYLGTPVFHFSSQVSSLKLTCLLFWDFYPLWAFHFLPLGLWILRPSIHFGLFHRRSWHQERFCNDYFDSRHSAPTGKGLGHPFVTNIHKHAHIGIYTHVHKKYARKDN